MAETPRHASAAPTNRIRLLTDTYRGLNARYREIEELSEAERSLLVERGAIEEVNAILRRKMEILREIRVEEERVMGAREWWKKIRRSLAPERSRELLSLLDTISRRVERTLALEAECRALLAGRTAWGGQGFATAGARNGYAGAAAAYRSPDPQTAGRGTTR